MATGFSATVNSGSGAGNALAEILSGLNFIQLVLERSKFLTTGSAGAIAALHAATLPMRELSCT